MCSSVISEFNIEIRNLISVFRFKFLQLIYAIVKKRFRIFRFRSRKSAGNEFFSTLLSFLFFFFSSVKIAGSHAPDHARRRIGC